MFLSVATSERMSQVIQANETGNQVLSVEEILKICASAKLNYLDLVDIYIFIKFQCLPDLQYIITEKYFAYQ